MKVLIIGGAGFAGRYLIEELKTQNYEVIATKMPFENKYTSCEFRDFNLNNKDETGKLLKDIMPERIFNLAAFSSVKESWNHIHDVFNTNVLGVINLLESVKEHCKTSKVLLCGSSEEYGFDSHTVMPVKEDGNVNPSNPYAISKLSQTLIGKMYAESFNLNIIMMRAFNHIGKYQRTGFVIADFCKQISEIEKDLKPPVIYTGNLEAMRDFTDVRDIVKGYILAIEKGEAGQIYNIGSGKYYKIGTILKKLLSMSKKAIEIKQDLDRFRPSDVPLICADITKLQLRTGWKPVIDLDESLKDTLDYYRDIL